jgi:hypothetical protein
MFGAIDGQPAGIIAVADPIKPTTPAALEFQYNTTNERFLHTVS